MMILLPPVPAPKIKGIDPELLKVHLCLCCRSAVGPGFFSRLSDSRQILFILQNKYRLIFESHLSF